MQRGINVRNFSNDNVPNLFSPLNTKILSRALKCPCVLSQLMYTSTIFTRQLSNFTTLSCRSYSLYYQLVQMTCDNEWILRNRVQITQQHKHYTLYFEEIISNSLQRFNSQFVFIYFGIMIRTRHHITFNLFFKKVIIIFLKKEK